VICKDIRAKYSNKLESIHKKKFFSDTKNACVGGDAVTVFQGRDLGGTEK